MAERRSVKAKRTTRFHLEDITINFLEAGTEIIFDGKRREYVVGAGGINANCTITTLGEPSRIHVSYARYLFDKNEVGTPFLEETAREKYMEGTPPYRANLKKLNKLRGKPKT